MWPCDFVTLWLCDFVTVWRYGDVTTWFCDCVTVMIWPQAFILLQLVLLQSFRLTVEALRDIPFFWGFVWWIVFYCVCVYSSFTQTRSRLVLVVSIPAMNCLGWSFNHWMVFSSCNASKARPILWHETVGSDYFLVIFRWSFGGPGRRKIWGLLNNADSEGWFCIDLVPQYGSNFWVSLIAQWEQIKLLSIPFGYLFLSGSVKLTLLRPNLMV